MKIINKESLLAKINYIQFNLKVVYASFVIIVIIEVISLISAIIFTNFIFDVLLVATIIPLIPILFFIIPSIIKIKKTSQEISKMPYDSRTKVKTF